MNRQNLKGLLAAGFLASSAFLALGAFDVKEVRAAETESENSGEINGFLYEIDGDDVVFYSYEGSETDLTVPASVEIGDKNYDVCLEGDVFYGCDSLKSVSFEDGVRIENVSDIDYSEFDPDLSDESGTTGLFAKCYDLEKVDFGGVDPSGIESLAGAFAQCVSLESVVFPKGFGEESTDFSNMFLECDSLETIDLSNLDTSNAKSFFGMFSDCPSLKELSFGGSFSTAKASDIGYMFYDCTALTSLDLSSFDTGSVTEMDGLFYNCSGLSSITLGKGFTTKKAQTMEGMFAGCESLKEVDISSLSGESVETTENMFQNCKSLEKIDLSSFSPSKSENFSSMFAGCSALKTIDFGNDFNTASSKEFSSMFSGCEALEKIDLSSFSTKKAVYFGYMFKNCSSLLQLDLSGFDTSSAENMSEMLSGCYGLKAINLGGFDFSKTEFADDMLLDCSPEKIFTPKKMNTKLSVPLMDNMYQKNGSVWDKTAYTDLMRAPANVWIYYNSRVSGDSKVIVKYVDTSGKRIAPSSKLTGDLGEPYEVSVPKIAGYTISEIPANIAGVFTLDDITVKLVYKKNGGNGSSSETSSSSSSTAVSSTASSDGGGSSSGVLSFSKGGSKKAGKGAYKGVYTRNKDKKTVTFESTNVSEKTKVVYVPDTVKIGKKTYKVTAVAPNAFTGYNRIKKAVIGKNVKKIGAKAFSGCDKMKVLSVRSAGLTKKNVKNSLSGSRVKKIKAPESRKNQYRKIFARKNCGRKVSVE